MYYKLENGVLTPMPKTISVINGNEQVDYTADTITEEVRESLGFYPISYGEHPKLEWYEILIINYSFDDINKVIKVTYSKDCISLESAKYFKLNQIIQHDNSELINLFYLNSQPMWFDKAMRVGLVNLIDSIELLQLSSVELSFLGKTFTLPTTTAKMMLATIEVYASKCYNITELHKNQIEAATTLQEVISYDYTRGYPDNKPSFTL